MFIAKNEILFLSQILCIAIGAFVMSKIGNAALTAYASVLSVLSNLLICKEITLFGFTVTASDSLAVGLILSLNLIQEWFGKNAARRAIATNILVLIIYLVLTQIHNFYIPGPSDTHHDHYKILFSIMPRLAGASLVSYVVVQILDNILYRKIAALAAGKWFTLRNIATLAFSELLDTILFSFLGLYGIVSNISDIILFSYIIKLITIGCFVPLIVLIKKLHTYGR